MFIFWVALFPFILLYSVYEGPKVWWLWAGGIVLTVRWIIRLFGRRRVSFHRQDLWFLGWIAVLAIASALGVHPLDSFIGGSYRHQGVLFFITLWLIMVTCRGLIARERKLLTVLLAGAVILESLIVIVQRLGNVAARPIGTFGEPNSVAGYIAVGLYFLLRLRVSNWLKYGGFVLGALAVVVTESRTGIAAGAVLVAAVMLQMVTGKAVSPVRRVIAYTVTGCVLAGSIIFLGMISGTRVESVYENRPLFWKLGWQQVTARPLLGYGAESGEVIYNRAFLTINTRLVDFMVDRAHNVFLDIALWSGAIGLAVFLVWLVIVVRGIVASRDILKAGALLTWLVFAFFQPLGVVHWLSLVLIATL